MYRTLRLFLTFNLLVLFLWTGLPLCQAQGIDAGKSNKLEALFNEINRTDRPGLALGIVEKGNLVYARGFGMANLETRTVFTPETVSDIGSVAKQFTCLAIVLLAQQGKLSLDDDIRKHLPEVPDFGAPVTIRHLMHHTSGIREIYGMLALSGWLPGDGIRQEDAMSLMRHSKELNFTPGDRHLYCNTGYMLLGDIISRVTGQRYEAWMRANIFAPLGMTDTYVMDIQGELFPDCAESYGTTSLGKWVKIYDNSTAFGQGGIYSTIPDLAKWVDNYRTGKVGGMPAIAQMMDRAVLNNGDTLDYAFGISHDRYRGLKLLQHTGSSAGYRAILVYLPDQELGILLKSNYAAFNGVKFSRQILEILFAEILEPVPTAPEPEPDKTIVPADSLSGAEQAAYSGRYFCPELESFYQIRAERSNLFLMHRRMGTVALVPAGKDVFTGNSGLMLRFERDKKQRITGLRLSNGQVLNLWVQKTD